MIKRSTLRLEHRAFLAAVLGLAALAAALLFSSCGDDDKVSLTPGEPQVLSVSELSDFAGEQAEPVYWVGERQGTDLEVTETPQGRIYVRYLEGAAEAGDPRANFLTVGTYPTKDGPAALRVALANREGAKLVRTDDGALLLVDPSSPQNAHVAYPGDGVQVEVFSPDPGAALRLASSGQVQPVP
jgi:hypothetical protein